MALKVKVSLIGMLDVLKFANMGKAREKVINSTTAQPVSGKFKINELAKQIHPAYQEVEVVDVIDHAGAGAKSFVFKTTGSKAAYFRAGQYLSIFLNIDGSIVSRPYSISSSPEWTKEDKYSITVRKTVDGFVSDWLLENLKVGDKAVVSAPEGTFYYEPLRDAGTVIALAGGSGITPFLSMAYALRDGVEDFNLVILSGSRKEENILFKAELDSIEKACDKVKVVHVLSDETKEGYENGFITAELIKKYAPDTDYSVFMCGPAGMYKFEEGEIAKLGLEKKFVRRELLGVTKDIASHDGYPQESKGKTYTITVKQGMQEFTIQASSEEPILAAVERAGIPAPARCRSGECGWCRSKVVSGTYFVPEENDEGRRWSDKQTDYIHPCASFPTSDMVIEVPGSYVKM